MAVAGNGEDKSDGQDEAEPRSGWGLIARSPVKLLVMTTLAIALTEAAIMFVFSSMPDMPRWLDNILDAVLLVVLIFPLLYFSIFRPFIRMVDSSHLREAALRDSERRLRQIVDCSVDAVVRMDVAGGIIGWNKAAETMFGWTAAEALGRSVSEMVIPEDRRDEHERGLAAFLASGASKRMNRRIETEALHRDGRLFPVELAIAAVQTEDGYVFTAFLHDITERKKNQKLLLLAAKVFENSGEGIAVTDGDNNIVSVNPSFSRITGYDADEVIGRNPGLLRSGLHDQAFYAAMWQSINETGRWQGEIWNRRKDGETFLEWLSIVRLGLPGAPGTNYIGTFSDITARREAAARIEYLAHHDQLTNLPNRTLLQTRLQRDLAAARRHERRMAVMFLDLDRFKPINDTFGHGIGDALLRAVAERLTGMVRAEDTVCRLGGDEFVILLGEIDGEQAAESVARKVIDTLSQPFDVDGILIETSTSVGIALFPDHDFDGEELIKCADIAMYKAKNDGRGCYRIFSPNG